MAQDCVCLCVCLGRAASTVHFALCQCICISLFWRSKGLLMSWAPQSAFCFDSPAQPRGSPSTLHTPFSSCGTHELPPYTQKNSQWRVLFKEEMAKCYLHFSDIRTQTATLYTSSKELISTTITQWTFTHTYLFLARRISLFIWGSSVLPWELITGDVMTTVWGSTEDGERIW